MSVARFKQINAIIRQAMNDKIIWYKDLYGSSQTQMLISKQAKKLNKVPTFREVDAQLVKDKNTALAQNDSSSRYSDMGNISQVIRAYRDMAYTSMSRQERLLDGLRLMTRRAYLNKNAGMFNI